jgi:hypothetical protein
MKKMSLHLLAIDPSSFFRSHRIPIILHMIAHNIKLECFYVKETLKAYILCVLQIKIWRRVKIFRTICAKVNILITLRDTTGLNIPCEVFLLSHQNKTDVTVTHIPCRDLLLSQHSKADVTVTHIPCRPSVITTEQSWCHGDSHSL